MSMRELKMEIAALESEVRHRRGPMKIALLFYGQPRYLDNPYPYETHKKFFLDKDFYDVDVYCHTWWDKSSDEYDYSPWSRIKSCPVDKSAIKKIKKMYSPLKLVYEPSRRFTFKPETQVLINEFIDNFSVCPVDGTPQAKLRREWGGVENTYSNMLSHQYSIEQVCRLCEESKEKYDFIVLSRLDNNILEFPEDLRDLNTDKLYISDLHPRFPDMLYFFGQEFLRSQYFYSRVDEVTKRYSEFFWSCGGEVFKYFSTIDFLLEQFLLTGDQRFFSSMELINIRIAPVRDPTGSGQ